MDMNKTNKKIKLENIKYKNVNKIVKNNLCNGCGICEAVCPSNCIKFEWENGLKVPKINFNRCVNCGRCYQVCPGKKIEYQISSTNEYEKYLGEIDESFIIKSAGKFISKYTASGGFITSFLSFLLDTKKINGALVVSLGGSDLKNAQSIIVEDSLNLRKTVGSVYFMVPLGKSLKELSKKKGKYAVVGLPCQIRGINNLIKNSEKFRKRIFIKISLFCGFMIGYNAAEYLLDSLNIAEQGNIKKISFRTEKSGKEGFLVEISDKDYFISKEDYTSLLNRTFSNKRCLMCNDMTGEYADISCGDAHKLGVKESLVIGRNKRTTKLIRKAKNAGYFKIVKKISEKEVFTSQKSILQYKKETIDIRLKIMRCMNRKLPEFEADSLPKSNFFQKVGSLFYIFNCYITGNKITRKMFFLLPKKLIKLYVSYIYNLLQGKVR